MTDNFDKSTIRIMLLDDEPFMLKLLARLLQSLGYAALSSHTSGIAALAALADPAGPPDLILLDLNMPEMDGIEFVRHLVERSYTGSLLLISGEDERILAAADKLVQAHKITVLGHLHKPVAPEALKTLLEQWTPFAGSVRLRAAKAEYSADALRDIPFDELKIDQGFVHRAHADETRRAIVEASLGLARQLGMEVVAEGVEDRDDWDFLRRTQCDLAQGYFIARPMPAAELPGWMETWQARLADLTPPPA